MSNLQALCAQCNLRKADAPGREGEVTHTGHRADTRPSVARAEWPHGGAGSS